LQSIPVVRELLLMKLRPCFDKPQLSSWQVAGNQFYRINTEHTGVVLLIRMKMRRVMRTELGVHANNDAEESTQLWHSAPRTLEVAQPSGSPSIT
jgi:hypothetical protein